VALSSSGGGVHCPLGAFVSEGWLMGGTSISWRSGSRVSSTFLQLAAGDGTAWSGVRSLGALLGPEGVAAVTISGDPVVGRTAIWCSCCSCEFLRAGGGCVRVVGAEVLQGTSRFLRTA